MKTIWQGVPAGVNRGWPTGGWAGRAAAQEEGGEPGPNPNLLLWTEEFDNAVWVTAGAVVEADVNGTADRVSFDASTGSIRQTSSVAASTGVLVQAVVTTGATFGRHSVTGTFDGLPYTFSVEMRDVNTPDVRLRLELVGGFLVATIADATDAATPECTKAQLEQSATATAYRRREGT